MSKHIEQDFAGKVALVTGAASGIGRAVARLLHARGASVVAEDRDPRVNDLADEGITPLIGDIADDGAAERAIATAVDRHGRLDILVNNAGIIINKTVQDMTRADWDRIMAVNATAAFLHSREAVKAMQRTGGGAIVNIASYAAFQSFPTIAAYSASKAALVQLTRALALEVIEHGIRVNAVGSGDVVTNILNDVVARPEEIAEVVAFLASSRASYLVGSVVMADGGMSVKAG